MFADFLARLSFNGKERERCWTKTATLLASTHISVEQHFKKLRDRARQDKKSIARVYEHIVREMSKGRKISEAVAKYSTPEEVMLIAPQWSNLPTVNPSEDKIQSKGD